MSREIYFVGIVEKELYFLIVAFVLLQESYFTEINDVEFS